MSKSLLASKKVMKNYLSELLTEETVAAVEVHKKVQRKTTTKVKEQGLEQLLQNVSVAKETNKPLQPTSKIPTVKQLPVIENKLKQPEDIVLTTAKATGSIVVEKEKNYRQGSFQALFFDVAGLTVAVPLIELGGIHNVQKTTPLMGKPPWFSGVMIYREEKINVVDTALWVMPKKCDQKLKNSLNYQYIIMLSDSVWGLSAEKLIDTVTLQQNDVKWLDAASKRPWLAGLVKDRMCALLDVASLIRLLDEGMGNS